MPEISEIDSQGGRSRRVAWLFVALIAFAAIVLRVLDTSVWMSPKITATVIDAESGKPVSNAIVVANWQLKGRLEGYDRGQLALFEVVTDINGRFTLPAWGPRMHLVDGALNNAQPVIRVFRRGYLPLVVKNGEGFGEAPLYVHSRINGKVLSLSPYHGSLEGYAVQLEPLFFSLRFVDFSNNCEWKHMRRLLNAFDELAAELHSLADTSQFITSRNKIWDKKSCGFESQGAQR